MTRIKAIVFDKDGTLFDFQATWGVWAGRVLEDLAQGDRALLQRMAAAIDYDLDQRLILPQSIVVAGTPVEICQTLAPVINQSPDALLDALNTQAAAAPQALVPGLKDMLGTLQGMGVRLAVMTNDSERPARAHLQAAGIEDCFDMIVGSDSGFGHKPNPDPLLAILDRLNVDASCAAMVGDSLHDLHAGRAAGMTAIGVLTGLAQACDLSPAADVVLPTATELPEWLAGLPDPLV